MPPATVVDVRFGALETRQSQKGLVPGKLDRAINVVMNNDGAYEKRDGYSALSSTVTSGSILSANAAGSVGGKAILATQDAVVSRDVANNRWQFLEQRRAAFGTYETALTNQGYRPSHVEDQLGQFWYFAGDATISTVTGTISRLPTYRVVDAEGRELVTPTTFDSGAGTTTSAGKAINVGTKIYYFSFALLTIRLSVFDTLSPASTPTTVTFYSPPTPASIAGFDIVAVSGIGYVVVWGANLDGGNNALAAMRLDTATNLPNASPGVVYRAFTDARAALIPGGLVVNAPGELVLFVTHSRAADVSIEAVTYTSLTTLLSSVNLIQGGVSLGSGNTTQLGTARFGTDNVAFLSAFASSATTNPNDATVTAFIRNSGFGGSTSISQISRSASLAGNPVVVGSRLYVVLLHTDTYSNTTTPSLSNQACYSLLDFGSSRVIARAMYEIGGGDITGDAAFTAFSAINWLTPTQVKGTQIILCVNAIRDGLLDFYSAKLTFETAPVFGPAIQVNDDLYLPGGYPMMVGSWGVGDCAPQFYPGAITTQALNTGGPTYTGTFSVCVTYVFVFPDGRELESQPSPVVQQVTAGQFIRITAPTLRMFSTDGIESKAFIRAYSTTNVGDTLYQQGQISNNDTVDSISIDLHSISVGKILYTEGNTVENMPIPPWRCGAYWQQRLFVSDTSETGIVYPTKKIQTKLNPAFMDDAKFNVGSRVRAMCPIDLNYLAIFSEQGISVISGPGPTNLGGNTYVPTLLHADQTCTNPNSVVSMPLGCMFQGRDGGIYLLSTSLSWMFIGRGIDYLRSSTVTSAIHLPSQQHVRFALSTGEIAVFDYARRPGQQITQEDALGQWYVWTKSTPFSPACATLVGSEHHVVNSDGVAWHQVSGQAFDATSSFIGMQVRCPMTFYGAAGLFRALRVAFGGTYVGTHKARATVQMDASSVVLTAKDVTSSSLQNWDLRPSPSKASTMVLTIDEQQYASSLNKGFKFDSISVEVQPQAGGRRNVSSNRIG